jgi:hypothetical protein
MKLITMGRVLVVVFSILAGLDDAVDTRMQVLVHQSSYGDTYGTENQWVGRKGESKQLEMIRFTPWSGQIQLSYTCHLDDIGDVTVNTGQECGTRGQGRSLQGFSVRVTADGGAGCSVSYHCHIAGIGDQGAKVNGQYCGTRGQGRAIESVWVLVTCSSAANSDGSSLPLLGGLSFSSGESSVLGREIALGLTMADALYCTMVSFVLVAICVLCCRVAKLSAEQDRESKYAQVSAESQA